MQVSVTVFDVQEKRKEWKKTIRPDMVEHLVFLDESGVNTNLTRLYGRALSSQRAVDHAPLNTPQTTTVLSSIRLNGEKAFTTYQGGTTGERFVQYLKETLLPTLKPGDIRPLAKLDKAVKVADASNQRKAKCKTVSAIAVALREDTKSFDKADNVFNKDTIF